MTGLRQYERERELPATLGDPGLSLPSDEELIGHVERGLADPGMQQPIGASLEYARWKPGVSSTGTWTVRMQDGSERLVTAKSYIDGSKVTGLRTRGAEEQWLEDEHLRASLTDLRPLFLSPGQNLAIWAFPADRNLRGAARCIHPRRAARLLQDTLELGELALRKRKAQVEILRYKPERRLVLAIRVPRRGELLPGEGREVRAILRIHPPDRGAESFDRRRACSVASEVGPELLGLDRGTGTIVEEWLEGAAPADGFGHASVVGKLLAPLHGAPSETRDVSPPSRSDAHALLERAGLECPPAPTSYGEERACWVHGDLHPDQVLFTQGGARLLDLDELRPGDPLEDLGSWIADHLTDQPGTPLEDAEGPLLEGYLAAGGKTPDPARLREMVATCMVERAAATLRRLERDAVERAGGLVARAKELREGARS